jgi:hypothetical protein
LPLGAEALEPEQPHRTIAAAPRTISFPQPAILDILILSYIDAVPALNVSGLGAQQHERGSMPLLRTARVSDSQAFQVAVMVTCQSELSYQIDAIHW